MKKKKTHRHKYIDGWSVTDNKIEYFKSCKCGKRKP